MFMWTTCIEHCVLLQHDMELTVIRMNILVSVTSTIVSIIVTNCELLSFYYSTADIMKGDSLFYISVSQSSFYKYTVLLYRGSAYISAHGREG